MTWRLRCAWIAIIVSCGACAPDPSGPVAPTPPPPAPPATTAPPPTPPAPAPAPAPAPPPGSIVDEVTGDYTLTLDLGSGCNIGFERTRTYTATITSPREANYVVTLTGGNFLNGLICTAYAAGLGCNQFLGTREGDLLRFDLANNNDEAHGGHIVEQLSSGGWVEIIGAATGRLDGPSIEAVGKGSVWYCPTPQGYPFPCASYSGCGSDDMRLTFARR